jgi:trehalose 6-phosphate phosphatase
MTPVTSLVSPLVSTTRSLDALLDDPVRAGLFCDFDGTLSAIVPRPEDARPLDGAPEALAGLAAAFGRVGLISGRPVSFLEPFFPPSVVLAGLYGLEVRIDGQLRGHPQAGAWREAVSDVVTTARASGPEGMRVESKGLSLTLHYRGRPDIAGAVEQWGAHQAARSGLELRPAKMSYELHPPLPADKGTALTELSEGLVAVAFIGDDIGDLDAYDALDTLGAAGLVTVRGAVRSVEESAGLIARADVTYDGPEGVLAALHDLGRRVGVA